LTFDPLNDPPEVPFDPLLVPLEKVTVDPLLLGEDPLGVVNDPLGLEGLEKDPLGLDAGNDPFEGETQEFDPFDPEGEEGTTAHGHDTSIIGGAQRSVAGGVVDEPLQLIGTLVLPSFRSTSSLKVFLTSTSFVGALNKRPVPSKRRPQYISYAEAWEAVKFFVAVLFFVPRPTPKPMAMATTATPAPPILSARLLTILCAFRADGVYVLMVSRWGMINQ